jgi:acetyl esterase
MILDNGQVKTGSADGESPAPVMSPATDGRTGPRLRATLAAFGLDNLVAGPPVDRFGPVTQVHAVLDEAHAANEMLIGVLPIGDPYGTRERVTRRDVVISGPDGNEIKLHVHTPNAVTKPLPAVVYLHGGGMTIISADNRATSAWCYELAGRGTVAVGVDFRNAHVGGPNPFPAGLDDCVAAVRWLDANREDLGISHLILEGESGGANLVLAVALVANREGWGDRIAGVYAVAPYISGAYGWPAERKLAELPSLVELDGYFMTCAQMALYVDSYDPTGRNAQNPLAWPYFASRQDLAGLPPHVITVDELDPLRDEGVAYFRMLQDAGVRVVGRVNLGLTHAAGQIFRDGASDHFDAAVGDIYRFAMSVRPQPAA